MSTFDLMSSRNSSEKVTLCHIEPKQRATVFEGFNSYYKKDVSQFVVNVAENGVVLAQGTSKDSLGLGQWIYEASEGTLYLRTSDDSNPNTKRIVLTYRLFFSSAPLTLPYNLEDGNEEVYYDGRFVSNSAINKSLDTEQIGLVLETSTSINLFNHDQFFDDIYDSLVWENKTVNIWIWYPNTPLSEKLKIFSGVTQDKSYSDSSVSFTAKDLIYGLRENVASEVFTELDGDIQERYLNKPKRRVFGLHQQLQATPIDSVLTGYKIKGTATVTSESLSLVGVGTSFLSELSPRDSLTYFDGSETRSFSIETVSSDTLATLTTQSEVNLNGVVFRVNPEIPYRGKNRRWHISGHKLRQPSTTISNPLSFSFFEVVDSNDFFAGDIISINGDSYFVQSVNGSVIRLTSNIQTGLPTIGDTVVKNPVSSVYINGVEAFFTRDYTVTNSSECILELNDLAEFNIASEQPLNASLTFTNGSRIITEANVDLRVDIKSRDWLKSDDVTHAVWYEILSVTYDKDTDTSVVTLRTPYAGSTTTGPPKKKNPRYLDDNSIVTVDCIGQESDGKWIKTASDIVRDVLVNDIGYTNINEDSFSSANDDANFIMSLALPERIGGRETKARDLFNKVNQSVFGSLVIDIDFNFKYSVLNADKPSSIEYIEDHDLTNSELNISSRNEIKKKVIASYRKYTDKFTGEEAILTYEYTNQFVTDLIGATDDLLIDLYLYEANDAETIAQRYALFYSLATSSVSISSNLFLAKKQLNDKVMLKLDRIYKRLGSSFRAKIGLVNKVSLSANSVNLEISDLGNIFNRVASISEESTSDFVDSSDDEKILAGFFVDGDTLTPDTNDDSTIYQNLIG